MKLEEFRQENGKRTAIFYFQNDPVENRIINFEMFDALMKKKLSNPETILEQNLEFYVIGYGRFNSILHYILRDNKDEYHLFTWNEFRRLENIVLEEKQVHNRA